nr:ribonuclease H-like domain, reverse transcriptase, RNA-dependent DNA polymerase [Tanacetum cinerariifolium]
MVKGMAYNGGDKVVVLYNLVSKVMMEDSPFDLEAYTDSDYAGANLDRKSTTEGCQFLGSRLISWQYKKQTVVSNSTTEADRLYTNDDWNEVKQLLRIELRVTLLKVNVVRHTLTTDREPSRPILTRNQLRSDGDICMYELSVSTLEPKSVKEAMTDPAWIDSMQEELL